jgi:hypothetical protein
MHMQDNRTFSRAMGRLAGSLLTVAALATPAQAAIITFDFTGGPHGVGTTASQTFTVDGVTVTATALSHNGSFQAANLGRWSSGLAVCYMCEMSGGCQSGEHQADNNSGFDVVLFEFSGPVDVDPLSARIRTTNGNDLDVSYWTGTGATPTGISGGSVSDGSGTVRTVDLTSGIADWLLFGAQVGESNDGFKITSLIIDTYTREVPEPASMLLFGAGGLATLVARRRRARA